MKMNSISNACKLKVYFKPFQFLKLDVSIPLKL